MTLSDSVVNYYDSKAVEAYYFPLVATNLIAIGDPLPPGTGRITRDQVAKFTGKARRGYRVRTVPRETGERTPKVITVVEHTYGFDMHRKALQAYERMGESALNGNDAYQCGQIVGQSLDDIILNGDPTEGVKGIFADAELEYVVDDGKEFNNPTGAAPDNAIVEAVGQLKATKLYTGLPIKMALNPLPYSALLKRVPNTSGTYMDFIAKLFPNGAADIYEAPNLPVDGGWLGYFSPIVAERNIEEDINTRPVNAGEPDKNDMIYFNTSTYQATDIHHLDAMMKLTNLFDESLLGP